VVSGGYLNLKKKISLKVSRVRRKKKMRKLMKKLRRRDWMVCYFKKNRQTQ
jgi:hypothetical protein